MSRIEKEIERIKSKPKDYTYDEVKSLLNKLGFYEYTKGKTSGSRVVFINEEDIKIELHRPHPSKIIKLYKIKEILNILNERGMI